jgi:hypothetical protein
MATTTNYGWTTPNDTDLVKDGAAAIRTLGSSIDTTTKALNPSTTLGDLEYRSATANTNTRLGIGSNGQYLTITGGVPAWGAISAGGMTLLSTTTLSGATTTISSIDQTYTNLQIVVNNPFGTNAQGININPNSVANNCWISGVFGSSASADSQLRAPNMGTTSNVLNSFVIKIYNYAGTTYGKPVEFFGTSRQVDNTYTFASAGTIKTASAISSMQFVSENVGSFSGGQVLIYGVK